MKTSAALLSALLVFPAAVSASIRVGRVAPVAPVSGTVSAVGGVSGARLITTPTLNVAGPGARAPLVSPTPLLLPPAPVGLVAPAPAERPEARLIPSFAAAAAADAPRLAVTQGVAEAAAASDDALRGGQNGQARAVGMAAFDGLLRAPAEGPSFFGLQFGGPRVSAPSARELAKAYLKANPRTGLGPILTDPAFAAFAAEAMVEYTFVGEQLIQQVMMESLMGRSRSAARAAFIMEMAETHERDTPEARKFSEMLGRWLAVNEHREEARTGRYIGLADVGAHLPPSPLPQGEYWDMAAGINAGRYARRPEVSAGTEYRLFDASPFVTGYIDASARLAGKPRARAVRQDILALERPEKPLAALRTKNAAGYVPGFADKLETMADWIAPGGQLIIQADAGHPYQHMAIVDRHGALVRRLLAEGWSFDFGFARGPGALGRYAYDTMILTRPAGAPAPRDAEAVERAWSEYSRAVDYLRAKNGV